MTGNERQARGDLSFDDVEIRPAHGAGFDLDQNLVRAGARVRPVARDEHTRFGGRRSLQDHRSHAALFCGEVEAG
jgi:hypothetical protein